MKKFFIIFLTLSFCSLFHIAFADSFREQKGKHFIIFYPSSVESSWAKEVLNQSERYYNTIANTLGYSRYQDFWTWNNRVQIIIYPNQETFTSETGLPSWARGGAGRDKRLFNSRRIITYKQEEDFLDGVLPHEISHLILQDFLGNQPIPLWLNEGVAQLSERRKKVMAHQIMRNAVKKGQYLSFQTLFTQDIRYEKDRDKVRIFYAQSISIIDFLIQTYGSIKFGYFCRYLKNGKTLEQALGATYTSSIRSVSDLEKRWVEYMKH